MATPSPWCRASISDTKGATPHGCGTFARGRPERALFRAAAASGGGVKRLCLRAQMPRRTAVSRPGFVRCAASHARWLGGGAKLCRWDFRQRGPGTAPQVAAFPVAVVPGRAKRRSPAAGAQRGDSLRRTPPPVLLCRAECYLGGRAAFRTQRRQANRVDSCRVTARPPRAVELARCAVMARADAGRHLGAVELARCAVAARARAALHLGAMAAAHPAHFRAARSFAALRTLRGRGSVQSGHGVSRCASLGAIAPARCAVAASAVPSATSGPWLPSAHRTSWSFARAERHLGPWCPSGARWPPAPVPSATSGPWHLPGAVVATSARAEHHLGAVAPAGCVATASARAEHHLGAVAPPRPLAAIRHRPSAWPGVSPVPSVSSGPRRRLGALAAIRPPHFRAARSFARAEHHLGP